nr:hypothetical protein [Tanacetum cinerariifolium]
MLDLERSTVTYTSISSDYEEPSDVGSPRIMVYGYDGLSIHPPSIDYVPGPEHPPSLAYVPYVSEPAYPEFMPPEDDVFPSDLEEDPKEEDDEDLEEDLGGGGALAPADSIPPTAYRTTARMSIQAQRPIPFSSETEVNRLLAIPTPPPSPLTSYSSPLPKIPSLPVPTSPTDGGAPLGYRAAMIQLRAKLPSTSHPLPLPPPIVLSRTRASIAMMRAATPEIGYEITDVWEDPDEITEEIPITDVAELGQRMTNFVTTVKQDTCEIYRRLEDAHDDRLLMRANVPKVVLSPQKRLCIAPGPRFEAGESSSIAATRYTGGFRAYYGFVGTLDAEIRRDPNREVVTGLLMFERIQMRL